jgi:hypothetical protein
MKEKQRENDYFIPNIEDFYYGYEYEIYVPGDKEKYEKHIFDFNEATFISNTYKHKLQEGWVRVPYLNKEQIEKEGWNYEREVVYWNSPDTIAATLYKKDNTWLIVKPNYIISLIPIDPSKTEFEHSVRFLGECKDINTLRYICKLLNI